MSYRATETYFDFEDRQFTREDHSWLCEKALRDENAFPTLPRYAAIPQFPLKDIFAKVLGRTEGMFPFLLQVSSEVAVQNLRAFFKAQGFCLKQNTAFTLLKSQQVERSTFQVLSPGLQRKRAKVSVYVTKLATSDECVIVEFRRSERNPVTVPTEFLTPREGSVPKGASEPDVSFPDSVEYGAGVPTRTNSVAFAPDQWKEDASKQLVDWFVNRNSSVAFVSLPSMRTLDQAAGAVNLMLAQLNRMRTDDQELQSSCKRVKLDIPDMSSFDLSSSHQTPSMAAVGSSAYGNAAVAPIAVWWNLNATAPSPTRSSFDDMTDFVVRHSQIKPRSETLQDRCDAFCTAMRLNDGSRVSLLVLEGAEALWEDLTITGRWHAIQRCLASSGTTCKLVLITNRPVGTDMYTMPFIPDLLRIRVPGEAEPIPAPAPPVTAALINSVAPHGGRYTASLHARSAASLARVPKLQLQQQQHHQQQHQWHHYSSETSVSGSDTYPHGLSSPSSESDDFSSPTSEAQHHQQQHHHQLSHHNHHQHHHLQQQQQQHHQQMTDSHMLHHEQLPQFEWDWAAAAPALPAQPLMFAPLQSPAHPTLYNIYDAFVASSYPAFDMFARPQAPMWFPGPPVMQ
eukprot:TRINITY_DN4905_c0_g2_i1.p1 TRINITY_DN4905_c0_g2~~TRINITY_DN4905_c0_g2_i1.p1  ORF type:complete len:625 (+),score=134.93 TRINITY_DN4905_c0_g2_i1:182-2056(+)